MFTGWYRSEWNKELESELKRVNPEARLVSAEYGDPYNYMKGPIHVVLKYEVPDYAIDGGNVMIFKSFIADGFLKRAMSHLYMDTRLENRQYPFRDRCSRLVQLEDNITLPGSFTVQSIPKAEPFSDTTASANCRYELSADGKSLNMTQDLRFDKRIYQASEWPSYRRAVMEQEKFAEEPVILKKSN